MSFRREQLLYDIKNYCYIEGHVMETGDGERRHTVQDSGEDGNADRITRVLDLSIAKCRELLYPYARQPLHRRELSDELRETPVYGIVMEVPEGFSQTTLTLLERLIHEYLVSRSVSDWMSITNPARAEAWAVKAGEAESEIRMSLHARQTRVRRRSHPF